jgi:hypothetical protein
MQVLYVMFYMYAVLQSHVNIESGVGGGGSGQEVIQYSKG